MGNLLTRKEVAARFRLSERTVRRLGRAGDIEEIRVSKGAVRVDEDSVIHHIDTHRSRPLRASGSTAA